MNWTIYGIECVAAIIVFTCVIMIPLCRNPIWWIHDYPQDIQEKYFENHERIPTQVFVCREQSIWTRHIIKRNIMLHIL